ncbi:MAG: energy-coupling factor transporter transmembrane component T family protein [Sarcina sp.]
MGAMLEYKKIDSPIHNLSGGAKMIFLLAFVLSTMISYDTRFLAVMFIFSIIIFKMSKVNFRDISFIFYFIMIFLVINTIIIFLISPLEGTQIYGSSTEIFRFNDYYIVTKEQLFYQLNFTLKYLLITPIALVFMVATDPSEFAASLNKIGVSYKMAYAVSIALRYIPDVQREYHDISFAQQARGIDISTKTSFINRVKNASAIIMPLIFSSLDKIETISCAMEIRAFGNKKKRTWYSEKAFSKNDYITMGISALLVIVAIILIILNSGRFYNPFI